MGILSRIVMALELGHYPGKACLGFNLKKVFSHWKPVSGESEAMIMDLHPDILSACILLIHNFMVWCFFAFFFSFFFQRKQISQTKIICASRGSWSWSTGAGNMMEMAPALIYLLTELYLCLNSSPKPVTCQVSSKPNCLFMQTFQVYISELLVPLHSHGWVLSDLCVTPNSSPDSFPQRWVTV